MLRISNRAGNWLTSIVTVAIFIALGFYAFAAPGDVTVTSQPTTNPAYYEKFAVAFTLNGTTAVEASIPTSYPIIGGSVTGTRGAATGTVSMALWDAGIATSSTGGGLLVDETYAAGFRTGLFEALATTSGNASIQGFYLAPTTFTFRVISNNSVDSAVTGTAMITVRHQ